VSRPNATLTPAPQRRCGRDDRPQLPTTPQSHPYFRTSGASDCAVALAQGAPVQIAGRLGLPASTVHAVLTHCRINRLSHIDRSPANRCAATDTTTPDR
jgi:hypothetical protein